MTDTEKSVSMTTIFVGYSLGISLNCRDGFYSSCEECGEYFRDNNLREHKGKIYCEDCLREILENETEVDEAI